MGAIILHEQIYAMEQKKKKVFADPAVAYYLNRQEDGMDNCGPSNEWFEFTVVFGGRRRRDYVNIIGLIWLLVQ